MASESAPIVVAPEGEIDLHSSPMIKEQIEPLIEEQRTSVVVDLSGVTYIDSSGLAVFIEAMQRMHAYGGKFRLCGLRENVRHIFSIARLDQFSRSSRTSKLHWPQVIETRSGLFRQMAETGAPGRRLSEESNASEKPVS